MTMFWPYPIDWTATGMWMQAWAGFAGAGAVVFATIKGTGSFRNWLRQKSFERRIEEGQNVLTVLYRARNAFADIRSGFSISTPATEAKLRELRSDYDSLSVAQRHRLAVSRFILEKINSYRDLWTDYARCLPVAQAVFGAEMSEHLSEIQRAHAAVWTYAEEYGDPNSEPDRELDQDCQLYMYEGTSRRKKVTDPVKSKIEAAIMYAESVILPILRPGS